MVTSSSPATCHCSCMYAEAVTSKVLTDKVRICNSWRTSICVKVNCGLVRDCPFLIEKYGPLDIYVPLYYSNWAQFLCC